MRPDRHRRGIGGRPLAHLIETALGVGARSIHVPSSRNAVSFYEHAGSFVDEDQPDAAIEMTWMTTPLAVQRYPAARNSSGIDTHL